MKNWNNYRKVNSIMYIRAITFFSGKRFYLHLTYTVREKTGKDWGCTEDFYFLIIFN